MVFSLDYLGMKKFADIARMQPSSFSGKANGTGKSFASEWVMIWKFRGGKVFSHQAFTDTQKIVDAIK